MSTNDETPVVPQDQVADLEAAKAEAEVTKTETTVSAPEVTKTDETPEVTDPAETVEPETTFTKLVPSIAGDNLEDHAKKLAEAYQASTAEALRLKAELEKGQAPAAETPVTPTTTLTPEQLYINTKIKEESDAAYAELAKNYPQATDAEEYKKFTHNAQILGKTITEAEGRLPSPKELYAKTAVLLGWTAQDNAEKLAAAVKDGASSPQVSSGAPAPTPKSKVTDAMIIANRKMYPGKTDAEIREELEPYIE